MNNLANVIEMKASNLADHSLVKSENREKIWTDIFHTVLDLHSLQSDLDSRKITLSNEILKVAQGVYEEHLKSVLQVYGIICEIQLASGDRLAHATADLQGKFDGEVSAVEKRYSSVVLDTGKPFELSKDKTWRNTKSSINSAILAGVNLSEVDGSDCRKIYNMNQLREATKEKKARDGAVLQAQREQIRKEAEEKQEIVAHNKHVDYLLKDEKGRVELARNQLKLHFDLILDQIKNEGQLAHLKEQIDSFFVKLAGNAISAKVLDEDKLAEIENRVSMLLPEYKKTGEEKTEPAVTTTTTTSD